MNIEKLKFYVDNWYEYIEKKNIELLEKEIGMSFKDFVIEILGNVYNEYKDIIRFIPVSKDNCSEYIIKPQNGRYSLEDFLINRLLRNVSMIKYQEQYFMSESNYDHTYGEVLLDKERLQMHLKDVGQKRKLVAHELLHGLKTQLIDNNIFRSEEYFKLKERIKRQRIEEVNDFNYNVGYGQNGLYSHCGLTPNQRYLKLINASSQSFDTENLDEIFNELDAIRASKDTYKEVKQFDNGLCVIIKNPESSNAYITNYAYIMERLLDKETLFAGMYIDPQMMFDQINKLYTDIFQKQYNSNKTALEIIAEQLNFIEKNPTATDAHEKLLTTLYECINRKDVLNNYNAQIRDNNITCLGNNGLLEIVNGRLKIYSNLAYADEYESVRNKSK